MRIRLAKTAGFCWGVKRAIDLALDSRRVHPEKRIYTYGPLIHNHETVKRLRESGIKTINRIRPCVLSRKKQDSTIILIRAHGIPPDVQKRLQDYGYQIIDTTCPHVKLSEKHVAQYARQGYQIIIVGDKKHAEVVSLVGYALAHRISKYKPLVLSSVAEAKRLSHTFVLNRQGPGGRRKPGRPESAGLKGLVCVVAQSTFQEKEYQNISNLLRKKLKYLVVLDTICQETTKRQQEVIKLARQVDALIVVGAHHSANTKRLFHLARSTGIPTFHIANETELPLWKMSKFHSVGITTGTSTPDWVIQRVIQKLRTVLTRRV